MRRVLEVLDNLKNPPEGEIGYNEADWGLEQTDIILRAEGLSPHLSVVHSYDMLKTWAVEKKQMRLASALLKKRVGRSARPYDMASMFNILSIIRENPEMKNDPIAKVHFDYVDSLHEGEKRADKLYAMYSRSINQLLKSGFIRSDWKERASDRDVRHRTASYLLTPQGAEWLRSVHIA